jgi:hypothetical protein
VFGGKVSSCVGLSRRMGRLMSALTADGYRLWDWAAILGGGTGIIASCTWYFVNNGNRVQQSYSPGSQPNLEVPSIIWWAPIVLAALFAMLALPLQVMMVRTGLFSNRSARCSLIVLSFTGAGTVAWSFIANVPQSIDFQSDRGHVPSLDLDLWLFPLVGLLIGIATMAYRWRQDAVRVSS